MEQEGIQDGLPDIFAHSFWQAAAQEMGLYSLNMILLRAGLDKFVLDEKSPPRQTRVCAADFHAFLQALHLYYGRGARGILIRTGRGTWLTMAGNLPLFQASELHLYQFLPLSISTRLVLKRLFALLCIPISTNQVRKQGKKLFYLDCLRLGGAQPAEAEPVCWTMLGLIQGALESATRQAYEVEEETCLATGTESCRFRIQFLA
jgi:hypothetical protein